MLIKSIFLIKDNICGQGMQLLYPMLISTVFFSCLQEWLTQEKKGGWGVKRGNAVSCPQVPVEWLTENVFEFQHSKEVRKVANQTMGCLMPVRSLW
jgi:hypothetical protein